MQKDDIRISVRNLIFREVIANTLIHREYTNPFPAKLIIGQNRVQTENANKAHTALHLEPETFSPYPKNPVIARVFKEIGRADELGSGVRNIYRYYNLYASHKPLLSEQDVFKCSVFIDEDTSGSSNFNKNGTDESNVVDDVVDNVVDNRLKQIILFIKNDKAISAEQIAEKLNITSRTVQRDIEKLVKQNILKRIGPAKGGYWQIKEGLKK